MPVLLKLILFFDINKKRFFIGTEVGGCSAMNLSVNG